MVGLGHTVTRLCLTGTLTALAATTLTAQAGRGAAPGGSAPERIDYLTFAQGAVPVSVGGVGAKLGANFEAAVRIADGDPTAFAIANRAPAETDTETGRQIKYKERTEIDFEAAKAQHLVGRGFGLRAAQQGLHAGQQFARLEGLGQVVVGARIQAAHAVVHAVQAGENQHRHARIGGAQAAQHFQA